VVIQNHVNIPDGGEESITRAPCPKTVEAQGGTSVQSANKDDPLPSDALPSWLKHSNQVLRFYGYFMEEVHDRADETWRTRRVVLLHYLEDGTTHVSEASDENGISMGFVVRRSLVPKPGSKRVIIPGDSIPTLGPEDLGVGKSVEIHGREIHLVDADGWTREHMKVRGMPQGPAIEILCSPIDEYKAQRTKPSGLRRGDPQSPTRFAEALLGRQLNTKRLQQFLEGNSRVLRFFATWDDVTVSSTPNGGPVRRPYKIHYYLEDDSVEVLEIREGNGGREFYRFLARGPLPKERLRLSLGHELSREDCLGPSDLRIGATFSVHGRSFLIHDADPFTKQWCKHHLGMSDQDIVPIDVTQPIPHLPVPDLPPHNGFGSVEDSERNCRRLVSATLLPSV